VIVDRVPVLEEILKTVGSDAAVCRKNVHALRNDMTAQFLALRNETQQAAQLQARERKSDRKWLVGAILSAAGLVIAAVGILAGHVG
jgi:hypothetical protein